MIFITIVTYFINTLIVTLNSTGSATWDTTQKRDFTSKSLGRGSYNLNIIYFVIKSN